MKSITLRAHFDGQRICLDEPLIMAKDTELLVTVLPIDEADVERREWLTVSQAGLATAYGSDEAGYPLSSVQRLNPAYEGE